MLLEQKRTDYWNRIETWKQKYMEVLRCFLKMVVKEGIIQQILLGHYLISPIK